MIAEAILHLLSYPGAGKTTPGGYTGQLHIIQGMFFSLSESITEVSVMNTVLPGSSRLQLVNALLFVSVSGVNTGSPDRCAQYSNARNKTQEVMS